MKGAVGVVDLVFLGVVWISLELVAVLAHVLTNKLLRFVLHALAALQAVYARQLLQFFYHDKVRQLER